MQATHAVEDDLYDASELFCFPLANTAGRQESDAAGGFASEALRPSSSGRTPENRSERSDMAGFNFL
jgi:hypothetical protein